MQKIKKGIVLVLVGLMLFLNLDAPIAAKEVKPVLVTSENTFEKTKYYNESPLGLVGGFHIVGFNHVSTTAHTNGNIATRNLEYKNNFGTSGYQEISYIQNFTDLKSGMQTTSTEQGVLVVGKQYEISGVDNGNAWGINGNKLDKPQLNKNPNGLWQDGDVEFIDFNFMYNQITSIQKEILKYDDTNVESSSASNGDVTLTINNPSGANIITLDPDTVNHERTMNIKGFELGLKGTLVINVDLTGVASFKIPGSLMYYTNGTTASTGETTVWEDANTIWNFHDSSKADGVYRGSISNVQAVTGHILAPGADISLGATLNGTVVGNNIDVRQETHRSDYTGDELFPVEQSITIPVNKIWKDSDNALGLRPESVEVVLLADGKPVPDKVTVLNEANGWKAEFTDLEEGPTYRFKEINIDENYSVSYNERDITNTLNLYSAQILKYDGATNAKLSGAEFELYLDNNGNKEIDEADEFIDTYISDEQGIVNFNNLLAGTYLYKEKKLHLIMS